MDGYVIDIPYPLRWMIVNLFILPFRPKRSAEAYAKIWQGDGSPLLTNTRRFAEKLAKFSKHKIFWAMRYGTPSVAAALSEIKAAGFGDVLVVPMYPHHALSSTVTAVEEAKKAAAPLGLDLKVLPAFYNDAGFIQNLVAQIKRHAKNDDYILFSYHGLPVRHITKADPTQAHCLQRENCCQIDSEVHKTCYRHQVIETTEMAAKSLALKPQQYGFSFQSRLGRAEWLKPMTSEFVADLAQKGILHRVGGPRVSVGAAETGRPTVPGAARARAGSGARSAGDGDGDEREQGLLHGRSPFQTVRVGRR